MVDKARDAFSLMAIDASEVLMGSFLPGEIERGHLVAEFTERGQSCYLEARVPGDYKDNQHRERYNYSSSQGSSPPLFACSQRSFSRKPDGANPA